MGFYTRWPSYNDEFSGDASGSMFSKIVGGIVTPLVLFGFGIKDLIFREAVFWGRRAHVDLTGETAVAFGIALIGIGLLCHFHFIWTASERLYRWANLGKILSLVIFIAAFSYVWYRLLQ